jgi:hypothetical protein
MDLPRFRGGLRTWDQGIWSDGILPSFLVPFFCSAPGGAILPSRPARSCSRRAQRRSRTAPLGGRPEGLSLYGAFEVKRFSRHSPLHYFLHSSFFVRLEIPFLRPDPHVSEAGAHRGCQGRPSLCLGRTLRRSRPRLDRPSTAAGWLWSG